MRALVISDTHFGAWTGEDLLREQANLDLLEPHLDVDEVIVLGDMFDFLFGSLSDAFEAATGLLGLLREKLQGKRLVCLAGNHDHHVVTTEGEARLELQLAGQSPQPGHREVVVLDPVYRLFEQRLEGVEVDFRYPTTGTTARGSTSPTWHRDARIWPTSTTPGLAPRCSLTQIRTSPNCSVSASTSTPLAPGKRDDGRGPVARTELSPEPDIRARTERRSAWRRPPARRLAR